MAGAGGTLGLVGAVARALVRAHGLQDLAAGAAPAWVTVALPVDTRAVTRTGWIQAVNCRERERERTKGQPDPSVIVFRHSGHCWLPPLLHCLGSIVGRYILHGTLPALT